MRHLTFLLCTLCLLAGCANASSSLQPKTVNWTIQEHDYYVAYGGTITNKTYDATTCNDIATLPYQPLHVGEQVTVPIGKVLGFKLVNGYYMKMEYLYANNALNTVRQVYAACP